MGDREVSRRGRGRRQRDGLGATCTVRQPPDAPPGSRSRGHRRIDPAGRRERSGPVRGTRHQAVVPLAGSRTEGSAVSSPGMTAAETGVAAFDFCGPLPEGTTVLEASAGTGKTHAIGALVTRYVAEDVAALDELLVITFGRAASQELRERVRGHLVNAERALADPGTARS